MTPTAIARRAFSILAVSTLALTSVGAVALAPTGPAFANCPPEAAADVSTTDSTVTVSAPIPSKRT
ncbi:hypothetical protein [Roseixanthobacter glucoisosaccharinicivorans]|uniref:hypothetical protein n=1 Tax=Roseixanthobacter glucoisosaccharinicivorans TaxID=3119923 RepID=UPI003729B58F